MAHPRLLLLDRPSPAADRLTRTLEASGYAVTRALDVEEAARHLARESVDLLLSDLRGEVEELLLEATRDPGAPELVLFEDFGELAGVVEELRQRAFDTLSRPVSDEEVLRVVRRALEHRAVVEDNRRLRTALGERFELGQLVSRAPSMGRIFRIVDAVADSPVSLLIEGESGTGKTLLARAIHARSARRDGPFVGVNCGAIPDNLLESELFGHARGAFTGAVRDREGKFDAAAGGTIFLDEVGTASPDLQVKLLRVLEEGLYERVGETNTRTTDARVIAATNADLEAEVAAGRFRADLYYRLHVVGIAVPPLRARVADVPLLAETFLTTFVERYGRSDLRLEPEALQALCAHPWPGNVRELENRIERAVLLARSSTIGVADLWPGDEAGPAPVSGLGTAVHPTDAPAAPGTRPAEAAPRLEELPLGPLKDAVAAVERWLVRRALEAHGGRRQAAARTLGINRSTLFNKMRRHGLLEFPSGADEEDSDDVQGMP